MIIDSLLDNDLYKFTMQQFAFHQNPELMVKYKLIIRNKENLIGYSNKIKQEIKNYLKLRFKNTDIEYLKTLNLFKDDYLNFLKDLDFKSISFEVKCKNNLELEFSGLWSEAILLEVPLLAIIQEIIHKNKVYDLNKEIKKLDAKVLEIDTKDFNIIEMGTRRRLSKKWQEIVITKMARNNSFLGTSNLFFAKKLGLKPFGTMAHEFFQAHQGLYKLEESQIIAMKKWKDEYNDNLNVVLTDIFNIDKFIDDYKKSGVTYSGFRQDSGDPIIWGEKIKQMMNELGQENYKLIFSDSLDLNKMDQIKNHFFDLNPIFGVGTFLTNDISNIKAVNLVIKMVESNGKGTIKISDEPNKLTCFSEETKLEAIKLNLIKNKENV